MLISKNMVKYGITTTKLNEACIKEHKYPIFMHSDYFIDKYANVYTIKVINNTIGIAMIFQR